MRGYNVNNYRRDIVLLKLTRSEITNVLIARRNKSGITCLQNDFSCERFPLVLIGRNNNMSTLLFFYLKESSFFQQNCFLHMKWGEITCKSSYFVLNSRETIQPVLLCDVLLSVY